MTLDQQPPPSNPQESLHSEEFTELSLKKSRWGAFTKSVRTLFRPEGLAVDFQTILKPSLGKPEKKLSRRNFLKAAGVTAALATEELTLGGISKTMIAPVEQGLREIGVLAEGNIGQFLLTLRELVSEYIVNPSQENLNTLLAWIKFNAAIQYASRSGMEIASELAFHFLYGEGKEKDVSELFPRQVTDIFDQIYSDPQKQELGITLEMSLSKQMTILFEQMLAEHPVSGRTMHVVWVGEEGKTYTADEGPVSFGLYAKFSSADPNISTFAVGQPTDELVGKNLRLFGVVNLTTFNTLLGLAQFTAAVEGKVTQVVEGNSMRIDQPKIYLRDTYDWQAGTGSKAPEITIEQALSDLGVESLFQSPIFDDLKNSTVSLKDDDGVLLAQKGFAHNFDVYGSFPCEQTLLIENSKLERPPTDYLESTNGIVTNLNK